MSPSAFIEPTRSGKWRVRFRVVFTVAWAIVCVVVVIALSTVVPL